MEQRFVSYYRVSTSEQGRSGLGLAAQQRKVRDYIVDIGILLAEFCDVKSGRNNDRIELQKAIRYAKRENAKLVIARLDRFSRRVSFIAQIMEQGIGLVCAEMPHASDFQLHIFAALAQEERRLISERTRAALAEAKRRGVILGSNGRYLAANNRRAADEFAIYLREELRGLLAGRSYSETARYLNERAIVTRTGRRFYPQTVKNYLQRSILNPAPEEQNSREEIS